MKTRFLGLFILSLLVSVFTGCNKDQQTEGRKITLSVVSQTFKSVKFSVSSPAQEQMLTYLCVTDVNSSFDAKYVAEHGTRIPFPTKEVEVTGLQADTPYKLYAVANGSEGLSSVATANFRTDVNTGAPATPGAVGIRVENVQANDVEVYFEMGSDCKAFKTTTMSTAYAYNYFYEQRLKNPSLTDEEIMRPVLMELGSVYEESKMLKGTYLYGNCDALDPDLSFTTFCIGMGGENGDEYLEYTSLEWKTSELPYVGTPKVELNVSEIGVMSARFHFKPNDDCKHIRHLVVEEGPYNEQMADPNFGPEMMLQVLRTYSLGCTVDDIKNGNAPLGNKHEWIDGEIQYFYNWGSFQFAGKKFVLLALPYDANMMPANELVAYNFQLDEQGTTVAEFNLEAFEVGAHFVNVRANMDDPNCTNVAFTITSKSDYEGKMSSMGADAYAEAIHREGWLMQKKSDGTYTKEEFVPDLQPGTPYCIVGVSLSSDMKLSEPRICQEFTTAELVIGSSTKTTEITLSDVTRTSVMMNFKHHEDVRQLYWVALYSDDPIVTGPEQGKADYLFTNGNIFTANIPSSVDKFKLASLDPDTEFTILWLSEDVEGGITSIQSQTFTTTTGGGGDNPEVTVKQVSVEPYKIVLNVALNNDADGYYFAMYQQDEITSDLKTVTDYFETYYTEEAYTRTEGNRTWDETIGRIKPGGTYYFCFAPASANLMDNPDAKIGKKVILEITTPLE